MQTLWMILAACVLLVMAAYAQYRIPSHTAGQSRVFAVRAVLVVVGIAFGYWAMRNVRDDQNIPPVLAFLIGFGLVHFPAAVILFIKQRRGSGKS